MRVLVIPEVYRRDTPSASGTLSDAVTWAQNWLDRDPTLHVYWLLPDTGEEGLYIRSLADHERVTSITAAPLMDGTGIDGAELFTDGGYSTDQLMALRRQFHGWEYVDIVVDQLRTGRFTLYKWLLEGTDQWAADVRPFDVVANIHDLQVPFKYRYCSYRNAFQMWMEVAGALFADGIWFTAGVDAKRLREQATECFRPELVNAALDAAVETGSPIDGGAFEERYAEMPTTLHLAGSLWSKKCTSRLLDISQLLAERYGIQTVMTSMDRIPDAYHRADWIELHPTATRDTYERMLERGDIAICASEYETMARTPFEQAASGQVLILRDEPWIYDCVPEDYQLTGALDELPQLATWVVEQWSAAVAENRCLVEHVKRKRSPERTGERTYADLKRRVEAKRSAYTEETGTEAEADIVETVAADLGRSFALDTVAERTAEYTEDGRPLTERETYAPIDLVYTLRALGYEDLGTPGIPVFAAVQANEESDSSYLSRM